MSDATDGQAQRRPTPSPAKQAIYHKHPQGKLSSLQEAIHTLFEAQVQRTPDAIALAFAQQQLSYQELNERANQLAHYLHESGVGPEVPVGLCLERSNEALIGLLGILKAGGAYVPLDPNYPQERLAYMLQDIQPSILLTHTSLVERLPTFPGTLVCLDTEWPTLAAKPKSSPRASIWPETLAYVIYTSGSTGQPKGTLLSHRGTCNLARAQQQLFEVGPSDRVLQCSSPSFDASIWEIVMALSGGACLCLASQEDLLPGPALSRLLHEQAITTITLSPSMLTVLPLEPLPALHTIIAAGEACSQQVVTRWAAGRRFYNAYGPTETTVCATVGQCAHDQGAPPIGHPIASTQVYVLDEYLQPVPVGNPGELYIGGVGLARGYHHRPALTAERFVPDPFSEQPGARLYRTGDLARFRADGSLEFIGRRDQQVKLRGYRIELGEIEALLPGHPGVRESVVVARESSSGDRQLVAYVVPHQGQTPTSRELRAYLKSKLPDYMLPSTFVSLETLPLTPNGKVDRQALPPPQEESEAAFVAPRNAVEEVLAGLWSAVLGLDRVSIYDSFFELAGHSLLATQLLSRIHDIFHIELPFDTFFQRPTVVGLAEAVVEQEAVDGQVIAIARLRKMIDSMSPDEMRTALQSKITERRL